MAECRNCGAPATGSDPLGPICCGHCACNPLGCRCKFGELGVPEAVVDYSGMELDEEDPDALYADDDENDDPYVMDCGDPNCCMPGPHYLSECHTPEMYDDMAAEAESPDQTSDNPDP